MEGVKQSASGSAREAQAGPPGAEGPLAAAGRGGGRPAPPGARPARATIDVLSPADVAGRPLMRAAWERHLDGRADPYVMYRSPAWWDHLVATRDPKGLHLGVIAEDGDVRGVVPLESTTVPLSFRIGGRSWGQVRFSALSVLGGAASGCGRLDWHDLCGAVLDRVPGHDGLYFKSIDPETAASLGARRGEYFSYVVDGGRSLYTIALPSTFEEYLRKFSGKTRYNLRRQVKALREEGGGKLELIRVDSPEDVPLFCDAIRRIGGVSWKRDGAGWAHLPGEAGGSAIEDVASRGLLRSYLLKVGDAFAAFVNGYQFAGVYHYADLAYDERFARLSPGTVLLFLLIEDLILRDPPARLNFGIGDAFYKQLFANEVAQDASALVLRASPGNRARTGLHSLFARAKSSMKRLGRRPASRAESGGPSSAARGD